MDMSGVPGTFESFAPLLLPIVLILINTVATAMGRNRWHNEGSYLRGQPIVAVGLGCRCLHEQTFQQRGASAAMERRYGSAGIIMLVTGGGGALGQTTRILGLVLTWQMDLQGCSPMIILPLVISTTMRF